MAYSDYGGYAYRNGTRVVARSDATITEKGDTFGVPGMWPGFAAQLAGKSAEETAKLRAGPSGHAVLGDGPIYVALYKHSTVSVYRGLERLDLVDLLKSDEPDAISKYEHEDGDGTVCRYINDDHFRTTEECATFEVDGHRIDVFWRLEDNFYQYVRLTQPDGNVWTGWSGYGVGAGLEDAGYGYSTDDREQVLTSLPWPELSRDDV